MKKIIMIVGLLISIVSVNAQAFQSSNFNIDIGYVVGSHRGAFFSPGVIISAEKGIHKWIGIGAYGGIQYNLPYVAWGRVYGSSALSVPFGATGSFHFYQMISDLVGKEMGSDKFDVAIKHSFGARLDFQNSLFATFDWGTSLNARYFFNDNFGIYAEAGYPAMGNVIVGAALKF